ncbi:MULTISPECIES: MFS transporter [Paenibacillus]|uniref:MFS transporter n=1 Tax=Paenibacillus TaxID=44249 RepID=UPI00061E0CD3|nr:MULTISPECIES: MFS transporter [Paenibacillus]KKC49146.1 MFS transporter [Paenibacillus sp. D9]
MAAFFLIIIYLAFISLGLPDSMLGAAWPALHRDIGAPVSMAGLIFMTVTAGTIVSSLATGILLKRFGTGKVTLFSCLVTAAALLGFSYAPATAWLFVFAVPLGLGAGCVDAGLNSYVAEHYKARHMSWLHCFWGVGATLGPVIMAHSILERSWRNGYLNVSLIQFGLVLILLLTLPLWAKVARLSRTDQAGGSEATEENDRAGGAIPFKIKGVKLALLSFLFYSGVEATLGLWGSTYLSESKGVSATDAAKWISFYYGGITAGRFLAGFVTFKLSNRAMIRGGQLLAVTGIVLMLLPLPTVFSLIGFVVVGLGLAPIFPCMLHETPVRFGKGPSQSIMGFQMAAAYTGSTLLPPLFGFIASRSASGILPLYLLVLAAGLLLFSERINAFMKRRRGASAAVAK